MSLLSIAIEILLIGTIINYTILMLIFTKGWFSQTNGHKPAHPKTFFSIIIPCRNEEKNLPVLLKTLLTLNYPQDLYEVIIIDDESNDGTLAVAKNWQTSHPFIQVQKTGDNKGKKYALHKGILCSKGEFIISIDADVNIPSANYLKVLNEFILSEKFDLGIGPVILTGKKPLQRLQVAEFMGIQFLTGGSAGIGKPIMCNGAHLVIKKSLLDEYLCMVNPKLPGGDDMFLMEYFSAKGYKVNYLKNHELVVETPALVSLQEFLHQRLRWASKASFYKNTFVKYSGLSVLLANLSLLASLFLPGWRVFLLILILKAVMDIRGLNLASDFFNKKPPMVYALLLVMIYPIYSSIFGILGLMGFSFSWKGRSYNSKFSFKNHSG